MALYSPAKQILQTEFFAGPRWKAWPLEKHDSFLHLSHLPQYTPSASKLTTTCIPHGVPLWSKDRSDAIEYTTLVKPSSRHRRLSIINRWRFLLSSGAEHPLAASTCFALDDMSSRTRTSQSLGLSSSSVVRHSLSLLRVRWHVLKKLKLPNCVSPIQASFPQTTLECTVLLNKSNNQGNGSPGRHANASSRRVEA